VERDLNDRPQTVETQSQAAAVDRDEVPPPSAPPQESVPLDRNKPPAEDFQASDAARRQAEILKEELETKAAAGDTKGAAAVASALTRTAPGSAYVTRDMPRILVSSWVQLAKTEFAAGHVDDALKTLAEGRRHFAKSAELIDLESRYVAAGDIYDRLSSAVTINVADTQKSLEALRAQQGDEYEVAAQMLAQTLADRIADERAADRGAVADRLLQSGKKLFPNYSALLSRGTAGVLANTPITVDDKIANQVLGSDRPTSEKVTADRTSSEDSQEPSGQTGTHDAKTETPPEQVGNVKSVSDNDKTAGQVGSEKAAEVKAADKSDPK
jgi:hypothetical protein